MKNFYFFLFFILNLNFLSSQTTINFHNQEKEEDGYLVYFEENVTQSEIDSIMDVYNSHEVWITKYSKVRYWKVNEFPFTINDSTIVNDMDGFYDSWLNENDDPIKTKSGLNGISPNYVIKKEISDFILSSDSNYDDYLCDKYYTPIIQGNNHVVVDILDSGLDINNSNIIGNSFIDQYNFITNTINAQDDNGHGTHVTSTILAMNQSAQSKIDIFESKTHNATGKGKLSDIVRAIDHSIDIGANIINASWSYYAKETNSTSPIEAAIEAAGQHGVLFIAAAGNDMIDNDNNTYKAYPASYNSDYILSVSSNACDTSLSYFSNYGNEYSDICAIGENVPGFVLGGQMALLSGTSQATAYVTAIAANIGTHIDEFDPIEVKRLILEGAIHNDKLNKLVSTEGIISINNSLTMINDISFREQKESLVNFENALIFPNPFKGKLTVEFESKSKKNINVSLYDINGKNISSFIFTANNGLNTFEINELSSLNLGVYYIRIGKTIKKIIKVN